MNGVNSMVIQDKFIGERMYKLTYLLFFLNPEKPPEKPEIPLEQPNPDNYFDEVVLKNKFYKNVTIKNSNEDIIYTCIEFCIKFAKNGNYVIELEPYNIWQVYDYPTSFRFFVKVVESVTCITHIFNEIDKDELKMIKSLKKGFDINILPDKSFEDGEEGKMSIATAENTRRKLIVKIQPLFDENKFMFTTNQEKEEVNTSNKGREKMDDETKKRNNKRESNYKMKGISYN